MAQEENKTRTTRRVDAWCDKSFGMFRTGSLHTGRRLPGRNMAKGLSLVSKFQPEAGYVLQTDAMRTDAKYQTYDSV